MTCITHHISSMLGANHSVVSVGPAPSWRQPQAGSQREEPWHSPSAAESLGLRFRLHLRHAGQCSQLRRVILRHIFHNRGNRDPESYSNTLKFPQHMLGRTRSDLTCRSLSTARCHLPSLPQRLNNVTNTHTDIFSVRHFHSQRFTQSEEQSSDKAKADEELPQIFLRNLSKVTELRNGKDNGTWIQVSLSPCFNYDASGPYSATTKVVLGKSLNLSKLQFLLL